MFIKFFNFFKRPKVIPTFTTPETRFLSNFYPFKKDGMYPEKLEIYYDGMLFLCVETAYQAAKTLDMDLRYKISQIHMKRLHYLKVAELNHVKIGLISNMML